MADYRFWCDACGAEIAFGGHEPGCSVVRKEQQASREQREFEEKLYAAYGEVSNDDLLDEALMVREEIYDLSSALHSREKKLKFLEYIMFFERSLMDRYREESKRRK